MITITKEYLRVKECNITKYTITLGNTYNESIDKFELSEKLLDRFDIEKYPFTEIKIFNIQSDNKEFVDNTIEKICEKHSNSKCIKIDSVNNDYNDRELYFKKLFISEKAQFKYYTIYDRTIIYGILDIEKLEKLHIFVSMIEDLNADVRDIYTRLGLEYKPCYKYTFDYTYYDLDHKIELTKNHAECLKEEYQRTKKELKKLYSFKERL